MADYVIARKTKNAASSVAHIFLNLVFGVGSVLLTALTGNPVLGLLLVIASKWRVFAVRPRYIWVNFKSNLIDLIIGISVILLTSSAGIGITPLSIILMVFYCVWLLLIKPLTSETGTIIQSIIAVFMSICSSVIIAEGLDSIVIVIMAFIVGYSASRHVLSQANEKDYVLTTFICGLLFSEIAWLCNSWNIIYTFGKSGIKIPQLAIILTIFAFIFNCARVSMIKNDGKLRLKDISAPIFFGITVIGVILICFSNPIFNINL